ncbi:FAD binding domain-containing protein [Streptomyces sp. NPDC090077]|uniref:FAD binding domain-containing protein n=1 Tax=Streptomyces sp. NPDC090077 TaxID=3365938 RepID=UPI0037F13C8B
MLLRLPTSMSEAQECMAGGAVPIGGATLLWATWQRDGFPTRAMSLRDLPEANGIGPETLGSAVLLSRVDDRVPEVLRKAAAGVGTGAVRRTATVGGNLVGSTLRCLLPAALVLDAHAVILEPEGVHLTDLAEVLAKRHLLLSLLWRAPIASRYHKAAGEAGGPPPLVVAGALHREEDGGKLLRVAVREDGEFLDEDVRCHPTAEEDLHALRSGGLGRLSDEAWETVCRQVTDLLAPPAGHCAADAGDPGAESPGRCWLG